MLEKAIAMIEEQQTKYQEGNLEYELAELMVDLCKTESQAAELIAQDMEKAEMSLEKCARYLENYARKNKQGCCYGMGDRQTRKLVREFYGIPAPEKQSPVHSDITPRGKVLDLFDFI